MTTAQLSVQLYAVKEHLDADLDATLARLAEIGLRNVEAFNFVDRAEEMSEAFARHGLTASTGHAHFLSDGLSFGERTIVVPPHDVVLAAAKQLGVKILIDPMVPPARWADAESVAATAARLNAFAVEAAKHGIQVGYHNHAHEFAHSFDGVSAYEYFASLLDDSVALEVDVYWAAAGGQDVPAMLERLGTKVRALHMKDGPIGTDPFASTAPFDPASLKQRPAGQGEVPLAAILEAAPHAEYAVIEFDHFDGDIFDGISESASYLNGLGVK